jgi:hypothetical protein
MQRAIAFCDRWARKIHIYASLLTFSILCVFGLVGLVVATEPDLAARPKLPVQTRDVPFAAPGAMDDVQLAEAVRERLGLRLANPLQRNWIKRDPQGRPQFEFFSVNGFTKAVYDESAASIHAEHQPVSTGDYLNRIHAVTIRTRVPDWRVRAWAWYVELSIWSMFTMIATSLWLWLYGRWRDKGAAVAFLFGGAGFAAAVWRVLG